jgi:glycosyltransferase involved in cell wall biosynthesis
MSSPNLPEKNASIPLDALRVCIVAEHASLQFGGEASLPLHYFSRLRARNVEVWLVIHGRTRREMELLFPSDQERIRYISDRWYHKLIWKLGRPLPRRIAEAIFGTLMVLINQILQRGQIKQLINQHQVNIIHQPIPVSPKTPSFISGLGVPVVIGPMNGGMNYPAAFRRDESMVTRVAVAIGRASANLVNRIISGKMNAAMLLVANHRTRMALPDRIRGRIIEIAENGVDLAIWSPASSSVPAPVPARFVFIGRLVDWKRLDFVLHALVALPDAQLEVIGDGPMRTVWNAMAESLGVAERVRWRGWLSQAQCAERLQGATALLLPSIYECGGAVVLEAMACGIPVVAISWGGPADYIDETCGILIDPSNEESIIKDFVDANRKLASDPTLRARLGLAGRRRVELLFDWNQKISRILEIYREGILHHRS